ncbi:PLP-dependent aminotransferase family protein [Anoxybacterium hadale]|uniref:PLP-dependent aminotransferase family protein n=1 Tax=Anoxybacterium hadale TaxID=3408580 RepID=A0ACD1A6T8_9FIRM|nr:PLP-dependent aminotransferase family protein [Clostridiales bacterium]
MLGIKLEKKKELTLKRQLYQAIKERIERGELDQGDLLPSTRELASALDLSRNTVCEAYDMLIAEGYVISRCGTATRVAEGIKRNQRQNQTLATHSGASEAVPARPTLADFRTGQPDLRLFPCYSWQQMVHQAAADLGGADLGYTGPQGLYELRVELAAWLYRARGMSVKPDDIFITSGATFGLHLAAALLSGDGGEILTEDPCHSGMRRAFQNRGCRLHPIPVDEQGMRTELLPLGAQIRGIYVTPSHQFPMGGILPAVRRAALIRYADAQNAYVIEDDYDSEFRYSGEPIAPMHAMAPDRVIYIGTFSKLAFPALRVGYAIVPEALQSDWKRLRTHIDVQNPILEQAALAKFLRTRRLDRHVKKMRRTYGERRKAIAAALQEAFSDECRVWGDQTGLHLTAEFPNKHFDHNFYDRCREGGILVTPAENHAIVKGKHENKLLLGYGHLTPEEIQKGVRELANFIL